MSEPPETRDGDIGVTCSECLSELQHSYIQDDGLIYDHIVCVQCDTVKTIIVDDFEQATRNAEGLSSSSPTNGRVCLGYSCNVSGKTIDVACISSAASTQTDCKTSSGTKTRTRKLKNSPSAVDARVPEFCDITTAGSIKRSHTVELADLSNEALRFVRQKFIEHACCPKCGAVDLQFVEGEKHTRFCSNCNCCVGLDDSINYFDLLEDLTNGRFSVEPCPKCQNTDPEMFVLDYMDDRGDLAMIGLKCLKCLKVKTPVSELTNESANHSEHIESSEFRFSCVQCGCGNINPDLFEVTKDDVGYISTVRCWSCDCTFNTTRETCSCGNSENHYVIYDKFGYFDKIKCHRCLAELNCDAKDSRPRAGSKGSPKGRTRIKTLGSLKRGDHIAWHQFLSYWHHGIVKDVDERHDKITVINYDGPDVHKGKIVVETKTVDVRNEQLYRIDYAYEDCYHPEEVIKRAMTRVGETRYNLLFNNCEHFARWSKTGHDRSLQSESFLRVVCERVVNGVNAYMASGEKYFLNNPDFVSKWGPNVLRRAVVLCTDALTDAAKKEVSNVASSVIPSAGFTTAAFIIFSEVKMVYRDVMAASEQRRLGNISRDEFIKITIKRVTAGCCSVAGVGLAMALKVTNNSIGQSLAAFIGHGVGNFMGRQLCNVYDKFAIKE